MRHIKEVTFHGKEYRIEVYPYSDTDSELVWSIYKKAVDGGWDKMRFFTRTQCRKFPKTFVRQCQEFLASVGAVKGKE
jgi:hypothetical protein